MFVSETTSSSTKELKPERIKSNGRFRTWILAALCVLPLLIVFGILWKEITALPLMDDYDAVLVFALDQHHLSGGARLLSIVTAEHNEYKLIFENAIVAADLAITGHLHLLFLMWVGNLLLAPLGFIYWFQFRPSDSVERRLVWFLPLCWLLFQLTYAEMMDWTNEGLVAPATVCFAVVALYLLTRTSRRSFVLACIAGALATFASANGFLVVAVGIVILLQQRRRMRLLPWCATFAATLGVYLYHYIPVPHAPPPLLRTILAGLLFVPSFLGGAIENMHGFPIHHAAIVLGLGMLLLYAHALRSGYYKVQPFIVGTASWVILTAAMCALGRASVGLNISLSSRYKIYSTLMIVFCYQYLADRVIASDLLSGKAKRVLYAIAVGAAVAFALASDAAGLKLLRTRKTEAITALRWYLLAPQTHSPFSVHLGTPDEVTDATKNAIQARRAMTEALSSGVYILPPREMAEACAPNRCTASPER